MSDGDLVAAQTVYSDHYRETWTVRPAPAHRWFFKYAQAPDEVMLIKCFDSLQSPGLARRVPHAAFIDPAHENEYPRESIEIRGLVIYGDDE